MELYKKAPIKIISVANPNRFWFRTKENERIINADIQAYMVSKRSGRFVPKLNEKVIVKWDERFEIAQIKNVDNESDEFFCLLTNGNLHKVKRHDITPLPNQLANKAFDTIFLGSIVDVIPAKMVSRKSEIIFVVDLNFYKEF